MFTKKLKPHHGEGEKLLLEREGITVMEQKGDLDPMTRSGAVWRPARVFWVGGRVCERVQIRRHVGLGCPHACLPCRADEGKVAKNIDQGPVRAGIGT